MKTTLCLVLCAALASVAFAHEMDNSWDYILYVSRWPGTVSQNNPLPDNVTSFTLHGIWPQRNDGSYPQDCNSSYPFDKSQIASLVPVLWEVWYDYTGDGYDFWSHEWDKHGTCASTLPALDGEYNYFSNAINLHQKYDPTSLLAAAGIVPSDSTTYSASAIASAIANGDGDSAILQCDNNNNLDMVQLCINKQLTIEACPSSLRQDSTCSGSVNFPTIQYQ